MSTMSSESESATADAERGRINALSWLLAFLAVSVAVLGTLSAERYELLWLPAVPILLLVLERRTVSSVAGKPRLRHLLPIFPITHGVLVVIGRSLTQSAHWHVVWMYAAIIVAALVVVWQLLKFGGIVAGSRRPRIDIR